MRVSKSQRSQRSRGKIRNWWRMNMKIMIKRILIIIEEQTISVVCASTINKEGGVPIRTAISLTLKMKCSHTKRNIASNTETKISHLTASDNSNQI